MNNAGPLTGRPDERSRSASAVTVSDISHVRGAPIAGQSAGSMQWVGQIQSAQEM